MRSIKMLWPRGALMLWVNNEDVERSLMEKNAHALSSMDLKHCFSEDWLFCVFCRTHSAWMVPGEGWRDGNYPPEEGSQSRTMINFMALATSRSPGLWFKAFVPEQIDILQLRSIGEGSYILQTNSGDYLGKFADIPKLMWKLMSGKGQTESEIGKKFTSLWQP